MFFFCEPFENKLFPDPRKIVRYLWRGLTPWIKQQEYVTKVLEVYKGGKTVYGSKKIYCPSCQFVETGHLMASSATNYILWFHRHMEEHGWTWAEIGLARANNDPLEAIHGDERGDGQTCDRNNDSVTTVDSVVNMTHTTNV